MKTYFTTSRSMSMSEFIEIEVDDRQNYELSEVKKWMRKYNLNLDSHVLWVASKRYIAWRYQMSVEDWDNIPKLKRYAEKNKENISRVRGQIINESNDSDDGFLMIVRR